LWPGIQPRIVAPAPIQHALRHVMPGLPRRPSASVPADGSDLISRPSRRLSASPSRRSGARARGQGEKPTHRSDQINVGHATLTARCAYYHGRGTRRDDRVWGAPGCCAELRMREVDPAERRSQRWHGSRGVPYLRPLSRGLRTAAFGLNPTVPGRGQKVRFRRRPCENRTPRQITKYQAWRRVVSQIIVAEPAV
jgi:hypothetical protein